MEIHWSKNEKYFSFFSLFYFLYPKYSIVCIFFMFNSLLKLVFEENIKREYQFKQQIYVGSFIFHY